MTTVVNLRKEPYDVYIGRGSPFGNRYHIGRHGNRRDVIEQFRRDFEANTTLQAQARIRLKGKKLGCFCKPLACHGDVIADYLNSLEE